MGKEDIIRINQPIDGVEVILPVQLPTHPRGAGLRINEF